MYVTTSIRAHAILIVRNFLIYLLLLELNNANKGFVGHEDYCIHCYCHFLVAIKISGKLAFHECIIISTNVHTCDDKFWGKTPATVIFLSALWKHFSYCVKIFLHDRNLRRSVGHLTQGIQNCLAKFYTIWGYLYKKKIWDSVLVGIAITVSFLVLLVSIDFKLFFSKSSRSLNFRLVCLLYLLLLR